VHLCFNNYKLSKEISKLLLRNIVNNDYDKIKDFLTIVGQLACIREGEYHGKSLLQRKRLEWIFGFGFLKFLQQPE